MPGRRVQGEGEGEGLTDPPSAMVLEQGTGEEGGGDDEVQPIVRQLEPGDTILSTHNCARIQGLDAVDALLLLCKVCTCITHSRGLERGLIILPRSYAAQHLRH